MSATDNESQSQKPKSVICVSRLPAPKNQAPQSRNLRLQATEFELLAAFGARELRWSRDRGEPRHDPEPLPAPRTP